MYSDNRINVDFKAGRIFFKGKDCLDMLDICKGFCCSKFHIDITRQEYESGKYKAHPFCTKDLKACTGGKENCPNRKYRLDKRSDNYCIYFNEEHKCSIYPDRPKACRDFDCTGGWKIEFDFDLADKKLQLQREKLDEGVLFILNPLVEVQALYCVKDRKELTFVKKYIDKCRIVSETAAFENESLSDEVLSFILKMFDGKNNIGSIFKKVKNRPDIDLPKVKFDKIVRIFNDQGIIVFKSQ